MKRAHDDRRKIVLGAQYFLYFGGMGILLPYFNLYCFKIGLDGFQIGVLSTLRAVAMVLFPLFWGALSDRFRIRKPLYILFNIASVSIFCLYVFTTSFWPMFAISFFFGMFYAPIISFLETITMEVLGTRKKQYGSIRVWGSVSFIAIVFLIGKLIDIYAIQIILFFMIIISLVQAAISPAIPGSTRVRPTHRSSDIQSLLKGRVIIFLVCGFLMLLSHSTYYVFFSIHLENLGFSSSFIGIAWALASISEIFVMLNSDWIFKRFPFEKVLVVSFIIAAVRWYFLSVATAPASILLTQLLHAITYGTFHMASILYIDQLTPASSKTTGQAVNNAASYGLGIMFGSFISGYLYEYKTLGLDSLFLFSSAIAFLGGVIFFASRLYGQKHPH